MKRWVVWNADMTEGFVTSDQQLAYEVRKCSDANCYHEDGTRALSAQAFIEEHGDADLTMGVFIDE